MSKGNPKILYFLGVSNLAFCSICKHFKIPFMSKMFKTVAWLHNQVSIFNFPNVMSSKIFQTRSLGALRAPAFLLEALRAP